MHVLVSEVCVFDETLRVIFYKKFLSFYVKNTICKSFFFAQKSISTHNEYENSLQSQFYLFSIKLMYLLYTRTQPACIPVGIDFVNQNALKKDQHKPADLPTS